MGSSLSTPSRPPVPSYAQQTLSTAAKRKPSSRPPTPPLRMTSAPHPSSSVLMSGAEGETEADVERARRASTPPQQESSSAFVDWPTGMDSSLLSPIQRTLEDEDEDNEEDEDEAEDEDEELPLPPSNAPLPPDDEDETSSGLSSPPLSVSSPSPPSSSPSSPSSPSSKKRKPKKRKTAAEKVALWKAKQAAADVTKATRSNVDRGLATLDLRKWVGHDGAAETRVKRVGEDLAKGVGKRRRRR
ncbi:hypothetical protein J4E83_009611 [Alternaria metachromatica]|uniref:uncharacterized protein n=1 Tax=Alternaria metachromatica TaxID=283354 RepID=UPI0020C29A2B|nr:uncharacterized protein J4E83_009611 [Alternaria metachromatica]KAI4607428.1 hypothetical protein J4E83_009611 [Alternaria metachromatica]